MGVSHGTNETSFLYKSIKPPLSFLVFDEAPRCFIGATSYYDNLRRVESRKIGCEIKDMKMAPNTGIQFHRSTNTISIECTLYKKTVVTQLFQLKSEEIDERVAL